MARRLNQLVDLPNAFTEADIEEMRTAIREINSWQNSTAYYMASIRTNIESLSGILLLRKSIEQFDRASAAMVDRTNKLTIWILILTILYTLVSVASLVISLVALRQH